MQTIAKDIKNDENRILEQNDNEYIFTTKVNYTNNKNLVKQKIILDKDLNIKEVNIFDENDIVQMQMIFKNIDYKATYDESYFTLKNNITTNTVETTNKTLDSIVYPMYIPENTKLTGQDRVTTENGDRIILTFSGDNPFMLVQEPVTVSKEMITIPVYGEPYTITGTIGALDETSITWLSNGVEFYVVSNTLSQEQLLEVANSINGSINPK